MIHSFKRSGRKMHDIWALIFFVIYVLTGMTVLALCSNVNDIFKIMKNFNFTIIAYTGFFIFIQFFSLLVSLCLFPGPLMHVSCFCVPIMAFIVSLLLGEILAIILSFVFGAISLVIYFVYLRKQIKYAAVIAQKSTEIISKNLLLILTYLLGSFCVFSSFMYLILMALLDLQAKKMESMIANFCVFLLVFWIFFNTLYSCRVLVASTVFLKFLSDTSSAAESFANLFYSLGSICFGGLLIALVTALRAIVQQERDERQRSGQSTILLVIVLLFIAILQDLIDYSNQWVFTYIALEGKSYVQSTKEAWQSLFDGRSRGITDNYLVESVLGLFSFFFYLLFTAGLYFIKKDLFIDIAGNANKIVALSYVLLCYLFACILVYSLFESGVKALTFTFVLFPEQVKRKDQKLADAFERRKIAYSDSS